MIVFLFGTFCFSSLINCLLSFAVDGDRLIVGAVPGLRDLRKLLDIRASDFCIILCISVSVSFAVSIARDLDEERIGTWVVVYEPGGCRFIETVAAVEVLDGLSFDTSAVIHNNDHKTGLVYFNIHPNY